MLVIPNSKIILLKNPIEIDYMNELTFSSKTAQYTYFYSLPKLECDNATYQRKDEVLRFPTGGNSSEGTTFEDLLQYNYCMYQNTAFDDKWFYAFVKKVTFDNVGMSYIELETDVFQTWMFDITYKNSFVEREHVSDDTAGLHTVPEGLEMGDYIVNSHIVDSVNNNLTMIMGATVTPGEFVALTGGVYTGIYSGVRYYRYDSATTLTTYLNQYQNGYSDAVIELFLSPKWLCGGTTSNIPVAETTVPATEDITLTKITTLNGYTPKNKKLLTHPYCYILTSNGTGQANTLRQEVWTPTNGNVTLRMYGCLTPGCSIRLVPLAYNGADVNYDEGITLGKFPQLNWATDQYTNWLTQQGVSIGAIRINAEATGYLSGLGSIGAGALVGMGGDVVSGGALVANGINGVFGTMQESYRRQLVPNTIEGNLNSGDVTTAIGANRFHVYKMTVKYEYAKMIDDYFSAYGYKVNTYKIPNITGRTNWNYVKTIGINITGDIPQEDIEKIKRIFNNGVTLWHNPTTFLDYSQSNTIVT